MCWVSCFLDVVSWWLPRLGHQTKLRLSGSSRGTSQCRIQKCRRPPSVSLGGLQRR